VAKLRMDAASQEHCGQNLWPMGLFLSQRLLPVDVRLRQMNPLSSQDGRDKFVRRKMTIDLGTVASYLPASCG
jgi:hypothetical protein